MGLLHTRVLDMEELPIANLRASSKHVGICPPELRSHICGSTCAPCSELACSRLHSQALVRVHIPSSLGELPCVLWGRAAEICSHIPAAVVVGCRRFTEGERLAVSLA